jgi:uncharacterized protein YbjT (DUF2867 family)
MKVVVFGASGHTGIQVIEQLLKAGHTVTALVRTPEKLQSYQGKITIIQGDARHADDVAKAIQGQDAVMHTLSQKITQKTDIQKVFAGNLVKAMDQAKVKRLVMLSAWGSGDSKPMIPLLFNIVLATLLKGLFVDKAAAEAIITASDIDYTMVRPFLLANGPEQGNVVASLDKHGKHLKINRVDVAAFMVSQLDSKDWSRQAPLIGYRKP